jgi:glyoxylase-like metal-dependent hydrolase (beta-lactamase superfamily II)
MLASGPLKAELIITQERIDERVLIFRAGTTIQANQTVAICGRYGIAVIDTDISPSIARRVRAAISKAFPGKAIKLVINTHHHADHMNGNMVYRDVSILAHEACLAAMPEEEGKRGQLEETMKKRQAWFFAAAAKAAPGSPEQQTFQEYLEYIACILEDHEKGIELVLPSQVIADERCIDLGGITLQLLSLPGMHTAGDIVVYVPESRVLLVGDMAPDGNLPFLNAKARQDPQRLIDRWRALLARAEGIERIVVGHYPIVLSPAQFRWRLEYFECMWTLLRKRQQKGLPLNAASEDLAFSRLFPAVRDVQTRNHDRDLHLENLQTLIRCLNK